MDNPDFQSLVRSVNETTQFVHDQRMELANLDQQMTSAAKAGRRPPDRVFFVNNVHMLLNDVGTIAHMASQALDHQALNVAQLISLKSSLVRLEHEIRLLQMSATYP